MLRRIAAAMFLVALLSLLVVPVAQANLTSGDMYSIAKKVAKRLAFDADANSYSVSCRKTGANRGKCKIGLYGGSVGYCYTFIRVDLIGTTVYSENYPGGTC